MSIQCQKIQENSADDSVFEKSKLAYTRHSLDLCYIICIDSRVIWQIKENVNCLFLILQYPTKSLLFYCRSWIKTNSKISRKKSQESRDYSKDVKEITGQLKKMVGVRAIGWHTNWGPRRFTACLTSLEKVSENHPILVKKFLSGK